METKESSSSSTEKESKKSSAGCVRAWAVALPPRQCQGRGRAGPGGRGEQVMHQSLLTAGAGTNLASRTGIFLQ